LISFHGLMAGLRAALSLLRGRFGRRGHDGGNRRVLVLLGAGASVEYKAPTTDQLTAAIEREIMGDPWQTTGGDVAFATICCVGRCAAAPGRVAEA
jgi:hypothetical protein